MHKLKLTIEDLRVTPFETGRGRAYRGTVQANNDHPATVKDLTCAAVESCAIVQTCFTACLDSEVATCDMECASADTECQACWV